MLNIVWMRLCQMDGSGIVCYADMACAFEFILIFFDRVCNAMHKYHAT